MEEVYCSPDEARQAASFIASVFPNVAACYLRFGVMLHPLRTFSLLIPLDTHPHQRFFSNVIYSHIHQEDYHFVICQRNIAEKIQDLTIVNHEIRNNVFI